MLTLQKSERFASFSKKKRSEMEKKINKSKKIYEGVLDLVEKPNVLFIIGLKKEKTAVKEAKRMNIPVIAICNTDADPDLVDYLIPGNDYTEKSVFFLVNKVTEIIQESKLKSNSRLATEKREVP
jgi:small subunit ribosomal protein S2